MPNKAKTAFATFDAATAQAFLYERARKRLSSLSGFPMNGNKKPEYGGKRGRVFQSASDRRSAMAPSHDAEKALERKFVMAVAARLDSLLEDSAFEHLVVAAGPRAA